MEAYIKRRVPIKQVEEDDEEDLFTTVEEPKKETKNKTTEILKHLKVKGSITSMEAFQLYGATRLSAIIFVLRKRGYDITTQDEVCNDRYGHQCNYARYILHEEE